MNIGIRKINLIPWNLFLSLTSAALHFWAITGPQDYLDKAPPYMPAYKMQFKDISKAYLGSKENMLKHAEVSLKSLFLPNHVKYKNKVLVNDTNQWAEISRYK
jgi:hypothetical protein